MGGGVAKLGCVQVTRTFDSSAVRMAIARDGAADQTFHAGEVLEVTRDQARELFRRGLAVPCGEGGGMLFFPSTPGRFLAK